MLATLSAIPLVVGSAQQQGTASLWNNGWIRLGVFVGAIGVLALCWAVVLVVAHTYAKRLTNSTPQVLRLALTDHRRISARMVRAEIATCHALVKEASNNGYYPWSSFALKLPGEQWALNGVILGGAPDARDAYHFASMAYAEFARINRVVTEMATANPQTLPEHRLDAVIQAAEGADLALVEFDHTLG